MIKTDVSTLKIHKLTQAQYEREREAGRLDENALYLTPDVAYEETDPTVPAWAKEATKPSYTAEEVNALPDTTVLADLTDDTTHRTVTDAEKQTWNAKSDFSGNYNDLVNAPDIKEDASGNLMWKGNKIATATDVNNAIAAAITTALNTAV